MADKEEKKKKKDKVEDKPEDKQAKPEDEKAKAESGKAKAEGGEAKAEKKADKKPEKKGAKQEGTPEAKDPAAILEEGEAPAAAPKPRIKRQVAEGMVHIKSSFNNTIITISDNQGKTLAWSSGGKIGFKGSRKSTPYAAGLASTDAARKARDMGMKKVRVFVKGPGAGRETAIRSLQHAGLEVTMIKDVTPIPHNGCRAPKRRRV